MRTAWLALLLLAAGCASPKEPPPAPQVADTGDPVLDQKINTLIGQLGSEDPEIREKALAELQKIGKPALEAMKRAAGEKKPPEVRAPSPPPPPKPTPPPAPRGPDLNAIQRKLDTLRLDMALESATLEEILNFIGFSADIRFFIDPDVPDRDAKGDFSVKNTLLKDTLKLLLEPRGLRSELTQVGVIRIRTR